MIKNELKEKLPRLKACLSRQPVNRVWVFGSFARGEENADSDIDLLVEYRDDVHVNLLTIGGIYSDLRETLGRDIDLVEDGYLCEFAKRSVDQDKILIYERATTGQGQA